MNKRLICGGRRIALALPGLGLCLFGDCTATKREGILAPVLAEITDVLRDPGTQWTLFVCVGVYYFTFVVLRTLLVGGWRTGVRWNASLRRELWLVGLVSVAAVAYAFKYLEAVKSTQALTLLGAVMLGQGAELWETRRQKVESRNGTSKTVVQASVLTIDTNALRLCHRQDCAGSLRVVRSSLVMSGLLLRKCLWIGLVLSVLGLCFFGDGRPANSSQVLGPALAEITAVLADPGTQWMVFVCAGTYFLGFVVLRRRLAGAGASGGGGWRIEDGASGPWECAFWLTGLMVLAVVAYVFDYTQSAKSTQALTLIGAAMLGQGAGLWESRKQKAESRNGASGTVVAVLIVLLVGAVVWQAETGHSFQYRGQGRWSGPWNNPNTFGMLMGVGAALAVGLLVQSLRSKVQHPTSNIQRRTSNLAGCVRAAFFLAAAGVMGVGLVKSFSRGAWVGAAVGVAYLAFHIGKAEKLKTERLKGGWSGGKAEIGKGKAEKLKAEMLKAARSWVALAIISVSVGVLAFWSCGHTERAVARRAYTVANANDFSWRNRVAAWEGALQMVAERPWLGFGWNQPERVYDQLYRPSKLPEAAAIQLNDYFILGTTLGLPALLCFAAYIGLGLTRRPSSVLRDSPGTTEYRLLVTDYWLRATCRAGAVVLLVGFWFDGGLFKLATAAPFWILLELGRAGEHEIHEAHENE